MKQEISGEEATRAWERIVSIIERSLAAGGKIASGDDGDDAVDAPLGRFLLSQMFHRIKPALFSGWLERDPVHVVMFGATNSGKSTVVNLLLGKQAAPMDSRARFTQHSAAFRSRATGNGFVDDYPSRFTGYHRYSDEYPAKQTDRELRTSGYRPCFVVYDPEESTVEPMAEPVAGSAVFWDTPDFSTEEALVYLSAVLDAVALGDIVIMTVTKENYADHRGLLLLDMISKTGVPVLIVANKLEDGDSLLDDMRTKLFRGRSGKAGGGSGDPELYPLPHVRGADEAERTHFLFADQGAAVLRKTVAEYISSGRRLKFRALSGCLNFIEETLDDVLKPLRRELELEESWSAAVKKITESEFYSRYRSGYLDKEDYEQYGDFNLAVIKWLDMLEIPGIGRFVSRAAGVVRLPFKWAKKGIGRLLETDGRPAVTKEEEVVYDSYQRWIRSVTAEARRREEKSGHPALERLERKLDSAAFRRDVEENFSRAYINHRERMKGNIEEVARSLSKSVENKPAVRKTLQGSKFLLDSVATFGVVASGGLDWTDLVVAPLVAPVVRIVLELAGTGFMEMQKRTLKEKQFRSVKEAFDKFMVEPVENGLNLTVTGGEIESAAAELAVLKKAVAEINRI